ncbi:hypothetical protein PFISCL1PPCAC_27285 [Pristionchus fissidentatus]|uniref:Serpentine receptor class gamma n=1 Tax=Pristionchus fissidentatus TaxID=1538716 RepID=A0AAV5WXD8_9BILA|nr:hypothetical protein PFISCL1PPCAC_27285 [Pristionchus fissidentatus]
MAFDVLQSILFVYSCLSMIVYSTIIFSILTQRRSSPILKGSFFSLVVIHFVADFLMFVEFNILFRARKYGYLTFLFPDNSSALYIVPRISNALHYYVKIIVYVGQVYFALNRLTSALMPLDYNNIWTLIRIRVLTCIQWLLPLVAVLPVHLNMQFTMKYIKYADQATLRLETDKESTEIIAYIDMACSVICTILSLIMYIWTLLLVRRSTNRLASVELRLLVSALFVFVVLTLNTVIQVATVITNHIGMQEVMFINDLSYPMVDLIYTCQPWALLLCSSVMRKTVMNTVRRRSHKPVPLSAPTTEKEDCNTEAAS